MTHTERDGAPRLTRAAGFFYRRGGRVSRRRNAAALGDVIHWGGD